MIRLVQLMGFVIASVLLFVGTGAVHGQQMVVVTAGSVNPTAANSAPSSDTVTVQFATADGTATAPTDYLATSGTLVFAPGVTQQQIQVTMVNPTGSGWFWVILSNPQ